MTTIACTAQVMAADSYATDDAVCSVTKCWRVAGGVLGIAGPYAYGYALYKYLKGEGDKPVVKGLTGLWIDGKQIWVYDESIDPYPIADTICAIGTGSGLALGAMEYGATPREAVSIASRRDPWTGGRIKVLEV